MVEEGQRRIMPDGTYVTVKAVGPDKGAGGTYRIYLQLGSVTITRSYGTVNAWPVVHCTNDAHQSTWDCYVAAGLRCMRVPARTARIGHRRR